MAKKRPGGNPAKLPMKGSQGGDTDFPWHRAVALSMDEVDDLPVVRFRLTSKTETVHRFEVE